jgi:CBS domain-containing protein
MTRQVVSIRPDACVLDAAQLMLQHKVSGLPVVDEHGNLVGIVTERDLLRRDETDTRSKRPEWVEFLIGPERMAHEYRECQGRKVAEVMTPNPATIGPNASLETAVRLMEEHAIKRLPVMQAGKVIGIIARPDLVRALAHGALKPPPATNDAARRARMVEWEKRFWTDRTKPLG